MQKQNKIIKILYFTLLWSVSITEFLKLSYKIKTERQPFLTQNQNAKFAFHVLKKYLSMIFKMLYNIQG